MNTQSINKAPAGAGRYAGERIVYEKLGVCRVAQAGPCEIAGLSGLYYTLIPDNNREMRIYVPVNGKKQTTRALVSAQTAQQLIELIPAVRACPPETQDVAAYLLAQAQTPLPAQSRDLLEQLAYAYGRRGLVQQMKKRRGLFELRTPKEIRANLLHEFSIALGRSAQELEALTLKSMET